jgi:hypothetical protein
LFQKRKTLQLPFVVPSADKETTVNVRHLVIR